MNTNLPAPTGEQPLRHAEALCTLLTRGDVSDICTWKIRAEDGIEGQLTSAYDDHAAYHRIHALAAGLDGGQVVTRPLQTDPRVVGEHGPFVAVEARGAVDGTPVRLWTHLHDPDAIHEARQHAQEVAR